MGMIILVLKMILVIGYDFDCYKLIMLFIMVLGLLLLNSFVCIIGKVLVGM